MLDRIMGRYASYKFNGLDGEYGSEKAIKSSMLVNKDAATLTVLFPPWRGGEGVYDRLTRRLIMSGSAVLRYGFHPQILEPDAERVLASYRRIQQTIAEELEDKTRLHRYDKVSLVATSLGNVSLALVARAFTAFDSATLVVPGSNLARCAWEGSRTQPIRESLEARGWGEAALDQAWAALAPKAAATSFAGKEVHMVISATDTVIPSAYQQEMVEAVAQYVPDATIATTRLGHVASVAKFCLNGVL